MNSIDSVAIRFAPLDESAGSLKGLRPVVFSAEQGLTGASLPAFDIPNSPLKAGIDKDNEWAMKEDPTRGGSLHQPHLLNRVIFVIDCSGSMNDPLENSNLQGPRKLQYITDQIGALPSSYFSQYPKLSLISFGSSAHEHLERTEDNFEIFQKSLKSLRGSGGTDFTQPLDLVTQILRNDQIDAGSDQRSLVIFLTDGQDCSSCELVPQLLTAIRSLNAATFVGGIGEDYSMARIVELAGGLGFASWGHTPIRTIPEGKDRDSLDLLKGFIPRVAQGIIQSESYLGFHVDGDFLNLTSASNSIFSTPIGERAVHAGYVRQGCGLLLEGAKENLSLTLSVAPSFDAPDKSLKEIPIIDEADAGAYFEQKQAAEALVRQWLASRAIRSGDIDSLTRLSEKPGYDNSFLREVVDRLTSFSQHDGQDGETSQSQIYSDETVLGTRAYDIGTRAEYRMTDKIKKPDSTPTGDNFDAGSESKLLHSGAVGPLDASDVVESLPPAHNPDALAYRNLPSRVKYQLMIHEYGKESLIDLSDLAEPGSGFMIGRSPDCSYQAASTSVSRRHCAIFLRDGIFFVKDLGSRSGTYLNEKRIDDDSQVALTLGDVLRLSDITITFDRR